VDRSTAARAAPSRETSRRPTAAKSVPVQSPCGPADSASWRPIRHDRLQPELTGSDRTTRHRVTYRTVRNPLVVSVSASDTRLLPQKHHRCLLHRPPRSTMFASAQPPSAPRIAFEEPDCISLHADNCDSAPVQSDVGRGAQRVLFFFSASLNRRFGHHPAQIPGHHRQ